MSPASRGMDPNEAKAIRQHSVQLFNSLKYSDSSSQFFSLLQRNKVINYEEKFRLDPTKMVRKTKFVALLRLLEAEDNGWEVLINYLNNNNCSSLANKLVKSAMENASRKLPNNHVLDNFKAKLANYYRSEYSHVPTMFGSHRPIKDVYASVRIEEIHESLEQPQCSFDHVHLLTRLAEEQSCNLALVKGHPGTGKTTLLKKIAYDWATNQTDQFSLILVVPLRYVEETSDYLQMTVDYYARQLMLSARAKTELLKTLIGLGSALLLCLDGLDEYGSLAQSPLKALFAAPFQRSTASCSESRPIFFPFKLLITSRPYACELIRRDLHALRFQIGLMEKLHLTKFVRLYCETEYGRSKVIRYLQANVDMVINIPLILTFLCYLADVREEIPHNMTLLYEKMLNHMIKREFEAGKLHNEVNVDKWKESAVIMATAQLAYEGCKTRTFEFSLSFQSCLVAQDSFTCGFLLQKFNFAQESLNAEFPHRSIQEFFAALYCSRLIFTADETKRNSVMKEILTVDGQFGRFFIGICSDTREKFQKMLDWLNPTFTDIETLLPDFGRSLQVLSVILSDCSEEEAELFGQRLAASLDQLENGIVGKRNDKISKFWFTSYNKSFQSGLNLNNETNSNWFLSHADNPRWSRLVFIYRQLPANLHERFQRFDILMWQWNIEDLAVMISSLDRLPIASLLIIKTHVDVDFEVNFRLNYQFTATRAATSVLTRLRHFAFAFRLEEVPELKSGLKLSGETDTTDVVVEAYSKTGKNSDICWVTVAIKRRLDQQQLIKFLIQLSLEMYNCRDGDQYTP